MLSISHQPGKRVPVNHNKKFVFFHIPRCGGTSLESFFKFGGSEALSGVVMKNSQELTLHHMPAPELLARGFIDEDTLKRYFKFTVIRDPFDRMASDYRWQQAHDRHREIHKLSFKEYLAKAKTIVDHHRYYEKLHYDHYRPMHAYCYESGEPLVDAILLLEDIDRELQAIANIIGPVSLPRLNHAGSYEQLRTTAHLDLVYELYEEDKLLYDKIVDLRDLRGQDQVPGPMTDQ